MGYLGEEKTAPKDFALSSGEKVSVCTQGGCIMLNRIMTLVLSFFGDEMWFKDMQWVPHWPAVDLRWSLLSVNWAGPPCPVIWLNIMMTVSVKVLVR